MSAENKAEPTGTCFVVMGFGKKTDFETGRTLDLNLTYNYIIKPAVTAAGLKCVRADEIVHSGPIDVPMYEQLLNADVVVADLSTSNKNAYYELGVRHALKPYSTVVICEDGIQTFPFDVNHVSIKKYRHMGEGIDFGEVERFRKVLTEVITEVYNRKPPNPDSPVYTFIKGLNGPTLGEAMKGVAEAVAKSAPGGGTPPTPAAGDAKLYSELWEEVDAAQKAGDFGEAKSLLKMLRKRMKPASPETPEDPYLIQRLALATYKSKQPTPQAALEEARDLLATLGPATSNDTETLGMWGSVHKRLWDLSGDGAHLDEAVRGYERGFYLRNDYYNGINLAYLLNVRAANPASRAEAVADFVQAGRVRREVLDICQALLEKEKQPGADKLPAADKYWVLATVAEAHLGLGDEAAAEQALKDAAALPPPEAWMLPGTQEQMDKLRNYLGDSPLKYVEAEGV